MPLSISVEQAAISAFATYLDTNLVGYIVYDRWPEADVTLNDVVTLIRPSARQIEYTDPDIVGQVNINATTATYTWLLGFCTQPIQLDVWTDADVKRDNCIALLEPLLRAGGSPAGFTNQNPVEAQTEVSFASDSGWTGQIDFRFDSPQLLETADAVGQREYRATYLGDAYFPLTVQATSARIAQIILQQKLSETMPLGDASIPIFQTIINSSS